MKNQEILKTYTHRAWNFTFEHPDSWSVTPKLDAMKDAISVFSSSAVCGYRPAVDMELLEQGKRGGNAAFVEALAQRLSEEQLGLKVLKKQIKPEQGGISILVYQHLELDVKLLSQKVLIPLPSGKLLAVTATAENSSWMSCAKEFQALIASIKLLGVEKNEDVEIVFGDAPSATAAAMPKSAPNPNSQKAALPSAVSASPANFNNFSKQFDSRWQYCSIKQELLDICKDEALAKVLWAALGSSVKHWLSEPLPALQKRSALQCLRTEDGRGELKALLSQLDDQAANLKEITSNTQALLSEDEGTFEDILSVPDEGRDEAWYSRLCRKSRTAHLYVPDSPICEMSDGMPYYTMFTNGAREQGATRRRSLGEVVDEVVVAGVGVAICSTGGGGWGWNFGAMCFFKMHGVFFEPRSGFNNNRRVPPGGKEFSAPPEDILPAFQRKNIKAFMQQALQIKKPRVFLEYNINHDVRQTLAFNLLDRGWPDEEKFKLAINDLSWFIPPFCAIGACTTQGHEEYILEL